MGDASVEAHGDGPQSVAPALDQTPRHRTLTHVKPLLPLAERRAGWRSYAAASGLTLTIIATRVALNPVLGQEHDRHLFLLPAVMLAAWVGGLGPGCISAILCAVALSMLWLVPGFAVHPPVVTVDVALFLLVGVAVSALVESLRIAREHAEAARAARDQLLAIVVHDLGNPLGTIKLSAGALRRTSTAEGVVRVADRIDRAVTRMTRLVHDLQDASQIERGALTVNTSDELVGPILREVAEEFSPPSQAKSVRLEATAAPPDTTVRADRDRLTQVLGNLVGNALRFTPSGGSIDLRAEARGDVVFFAVKDTGPGIPPENARHVFERYWKTHEGGTGLGLFIADGIVRAHSGRLDVLSTPGFGATFFFTIPRVHRTAVERAEPPPATETEEQLLSG
jgi:signal transduction histidine kinase